MNKLTKEDIITVLNVFKDYSYWMYFSKEAVEALNKSFANSDKEPVRVNVRDDGYIELIRIRDGKIGVFDVVVCTSQRVPDTLDNIGFKAKLLNKNELSEEDALFFKDVDIFVLNYFQRAISFTFFSRMHLETINSIAGALHGALEEDYKKKGV